MIDKTQTYNITDIWKQVSNIGYSKYINVSDGTERTVPWGHLEWLGFSGSCIVFIAVTIAVVKYLGASHGL